MRSLPGIVILALFLVSGCGDKNAPAERKAPVDDASPMQSGQMKYAVVCLGCHGQDGKGQPPFPRLAGRPAEELAAMLKDYRAGKARGPQSAAMMPFAKILSDAEIDAIAGYLAAR